MCNLSSTESSFSPLLPAEVQGGLFLVQALLLVYSWIQERQLINPPKGTCGNGCLAGKSVRFTTVRCLGISADAPALAVSPSRVFLSHGCHAPRRGSWGPLVLWWKKAIQSSTVPVQTKHPSSFSGPEHRIPSSRGNFFFNNAFLKWTVT